MSLSRRSFFVGLGALVAAPAIVRVASLMPVKAIDTGVMTFDDYCERILRPRQLISARMVNQEAIKMFQNSNAFLQALNEDWEKVYARHDAKIGTTLRIRLPNDFRVIQSHPKLSEMFPI